MTRPAGSSVRGRWTIVAIFALGGAVLAGLFLAPRSQSPTAPAGVPFGVPPRDLRIVLYDLAAGPRDAPPAAAAIRAVVADPDFVLLAGVTADDVPPVARALGMDASYHPQLFQRVKIGPVAGPGGVCVLSKHPLYEGRSLKQGKKAVFGVAAIAVVDGRKFQVACVLIPSADGSGPGSAEAPEPIASYLENAHPTVIGGAGGGPAAGDRPLWIVTTPGSTIRNSSGEDPSRRWVWMNVSGSGQVFDALHPRHN